MVFLPWGAVLHELFLLTECSSSSRTARVLTYTLAYSPLGTTCSSVNPPWATVSPRSLLLHELCMGCIFMQSIYTCSTVGSSTGCIVEICCSMVLHGLQGDSLLHHGPLHLHLQHLLLFLLHKSLCLQGCFSHIFSLFCSQHSVFNHFLIMLSQRHHQCLWFSQLWPAMGPFQSKLEMAFIWHLAAAVPFSWKTPLQPLKTFPITV